MSDLKKNQPVEKNLLALALSPLPRHPPSHQYWKSMLFIAVSCLRLPLPKL